MNTLATEHMDPALHDLDLQSNQQILKRLVDSQQQAVVAVDHVIDDIALAVDAAAGRLATGVGRLVMVGAGASGRLAVQDGAEMWPTFGWPHDRLLLCMAGGEPALLHSVEGIEDDASLALQEVEKAAISQDDVVLAVAASGRSAWTCNWLKQSRSRGALTIGMANNQATPLLEIAAHSLWLDSGREVLAGSTRMAAGTAQKIALNVFSTTLMIRLNRTWGNLMVDMAASNKKLDDRRIRMLCEVLPKIDNLEAAEALEAAGGWVKLAALLALGDSVETGTARLDMHHGSLRAAIQSLNPDS
ncbi:MAG: N-acetylmuramic acid 6-phosphate etherase [Granulosicoccus sp.]